jgi:sugar/nucleoside kinase (ribokinase family)
MLVKCSEDAAAAAADAASRGSMSQHAAAAAAIGFPPDSSLPAAVLSLILRHCHGGVVTRGVLGCVASSRDMQQAAAAGASTDAALVAVPAVPGIAVVDTTGAGDHFTAG